MTGVAVAAGVSANATVDACVDVGDVGVSECECR